MAHFGIQFLIVDFHMVKWEEIARRGRNHAVLAMDIACEAFQKGYLGKLLGKDFNPKHFRQFNGARWMDSAEIAEWISLLKKEIQNDPGYLIKVGSIAEKWVNEFKKECHKLDNMDWKKYSNGKLASEFERLCDVQRHAYITAYQYIIINRFFPDAIIEIVSEREKDPNRQMELLSALTSMERKTDMVKERESLVKIAEMMQMGDENVDSAIRAHVSKYAHLGHYVFYGHAHTEKSIRKRAEEILEKGLQHELELLARQRQKGEFGKELKRKWALSNEERKQLDTLAMWIWLSMEGDESYALFTHKSKKLFEEVGKRLRLRPGEIIEMRALEITEALENNKVFDAAFKKRIAARYNDSAILLWNGKIELLEGEDLGKYSKKEQKAEAEYTHITELKGMAASAGHATGKAIVIHSITEIGKVKRGDILVASSTMPAFVPAMEKAAAIVTNEGGLLSHAAIVSREFGKPCIVGTKIATKVFKDGDMLEVDAVKGIVRKRSD